MQLINDKFEIFDKVGSEVTALSDWMSVMRTVDRSFSSDLHLAR